MRASTLLGTILCTVFLAGTGCGGNEPTVFRIAMGNDFAPYDVGALSGLNYDVLKAVCDANPNMKCEIVDAPYSHCFTTNASGEAILGSQLAGETYDGCIGWFITSARSALGVSFSKDYAKGLPAHLLMASSGTAPSGTDLGGGKVGFLNGFFNDATCLGKHYTNFDNQFFDAANRTDALSALSNGGLTYLFWDTAPPIDPPSGTKYVGNPIGDCPDAGLALAAYGSRANGLVAAFNQGLSTIVSNGTLAQLCTAAASKYGKGDPQCILP